MDFDTIARARLREAADMANALTLLAEKKGQPAMRELAADLAEALADVAEALDEAGSRALSRAGG